MPRPPCPIHPVAVPFAPDALDRLAVTLAEVWLGSDHAQLVRARTGSGRPEVGLCALPPGVHPTEALIGHTVPRRWSVSGVVAPARARSLDVSGDEGTPVAVAVLVGRDGHLSHHVASTEPGFPALGDEADPVGRVPDLLRRTLGLPTAPPEGPAAAWWQTLWLDGVVTVAATTPGTAPAPGSPGGDVLPAGLVAALAADPVLCGRGGWAKLRAIVADDGPEDRSSDADAAAIREAMAPFVDAPTARWMDDGSFARWLLGSLPPVPDLLDLAAALVPEATMAPLRDLFGVAADGIPDRR